ncbi:hypothetical protein D2Q93_13810 [Alicyclobacillaceae bacterium I2511]|jgi:hypothetical protein|nr:hypothetical protein D2Q93_13810 [Alicyclobacillaceae bacterium I2511]
MRTLYVDALTAVELGQETLTIRHRDNHLSVNTTLTVDEIQTVALMEHSAEIDWFPNLVGIRLIDGSNVLLPMEKWEDAWKLVGILRDVQEGEYGKKW